MQEKIDDIRAGDLPHKDTASKHQMGSFLELNVESPCDDEIQFFIVTVTKNINPAAETLPNLLNSAVRHFLSLPLYHRFSSLLSIPLLLHTKTGKDIAIKLPKYS